MRWTFGGSRALRGAAIWLVLSPVHVAGQQTLGVPSPQVDDAEGLEARVWLDRGDEPVLATGDDVRVYYRTSEDAWAAIFRIDTDGRVSLLFPQHPDVDPWVGGGRDYRLLLDRTPRWRVRDEPGLGYFFMIASPEPLDLSAFDYDDRYGWDLSAVGETVYEDPYVAIDDYVAAMLPDWESVPYGLDFLSYSVGEKQEYPRFLCYDCHQYRSYSSWNPYAYPCTTYEVVVWDDPYFAPRYRYAGTRVVYARPFGPRPRYAVSVRTVRAPRAVVWRSRPAPSRRLTEYKEPVRRPSIATPGRTEPRVAPRPGGGVSRTGPATPSGRSLRPGPERRPERVSPGRAAPRAAPAARAPEARPAPARPTLQRRPTASSPRAAPDRQPPRASSAPPQSRGGGAVRSPRSTPASASPPARSGAAERGSRTSGRTPAVAPPRARGSSGPGRPAARTPPPRSGGAAAPARSRPRRPSGGRGG